MPTARAEPRSVARPVRIDAFRAGVALATVGVAGFLLAQLRAWPPHEDETLALFIGRQPLGDLFDTVLGERGGAPLHFLLTHLVALVSPGLTGVRLISVAFAVASIPVIAQLVARLTSRGIALLATFVVATSWTLLFHGVYGRMYSLFLFTSALSFLLLLRALSTGTWKRWLAWGVVMLAVLASMPYGAMVLAVQAAYVGARRIRQPFPLHGPLVAFGVVTLLAIPLWRTYLVLASRFDVGVGDHSRSSLGSPYDVLAYVREVIGDFTAGWTLVFALVVALAAVGLVDLARARPAGALLAGSVFAVPTAALLVAGLGSSAVPETRHLIFALPFLAMLVAAGLARAASAAGTHARAVLWLGLALFVSAQIAWGWQRTPALYAGEPPQRAAAREEAAAWLAGFLRPTDVLLGYNPLFLQAFENGADVGDAVIPRADAGLALRRLQELPTPIGRPVWVHDVSNGGITPRFEVEAALPAGDGFASRAFGPFLVVWTTEPVYTPAEYLRRTLDVQRLGHDLGAGDADLNYVTALAALEELAGAPPGG